MIDQSIREEAKKFAGFWNSIFIKNPELKLDGTWPSIGIVDKILFPLRAKSSFNKSDTDFIKGAAAYIGIMAHKIWSSYEDTECELIKIGDGAEDYLLKAKGGNFLKENEEFSILLCRTIETSLKNSSKQIQFFADDSRFYSFDDNLLSSVSAGIISGLCPQGQGSWNKNSQKAFETNLVKCAKILSESTVDYYIKRYAGEPHGQNESLYFPHLILPPIKYNEPHHGARSSASLCNFINSKKLKLSEINVLLKNLCLNADETISTAAYIVSCALLEDKKPEWLFYIGNAKGITNPLLRPSIAFCKNAFSKKDFLEEIKIGNIKEAINLIQFEYNLGLLPLLFLSDLNKIDKLPDSLLYFISWSSAGKAHDTIKNYHIFEKLDEDLALQYCFLKINCGLHKEAKDILEIHFSNNAPKDKENKFRYFEILSLLANSENDKANLLNYIEEAMLTGTSDPIRFATVGNHLARIYLQTDNHEQAVTLSEKVTEICPWWLSAHLTKLIGLLALKRHDEIEYLLAELSPYMSISNHLFSYAKAHLLSKVK